MKSGLLNFDPGARSAIFGTPKMAKTGYKSTFVCESDHIILFMFTLIFSHQERESGRGGDNQRWRIESIVTCAPIPLRVEVAFTITRKPTVEARNMIVHSAKNHLVKVCSHFSTKQTGHLREHFMKHAGEKPYQCNQCEYTSTKSSHLQRHKRTHSGEKPHRCTMCEFSSITTGHLKEHMMTNHSGEKLHKCNQCNFTCTISRNLQRHMTTHTGLSQAFQVQPMQQSLRT